jgi:uncharacterized membrane protein YtjA (UPF0391 family)
MRCDDPSHSDRLNMLSIYRATESRRRAVTGFGTGIAYSTALIALHMRSQIQASHERTAMLYNALLFLVIALIAGLLGLGAVTGVALWIARVLLLVFLVMIVLSLVTGRRPPVT